MSEAESVNKFSAIMTAALGNQSVGWAFALFKGGTHKVSKGGGLATGVNGSLSSPLLMTEHRKVAIGSISKTVTAAATLLALRQQGGRTGIRSIINDFRPSSWNLATKSKNLNFAQILTHRSGLVPFPLQFDPALQGSGPEPNTTSNLKLSLVLGPLVDPPGPSVYQNINYSLMRVLIPYMTSGGILNSGFESAPFFDIVLGTLYSQFVKTHLFAPLGISADATPPNKENAVEYVEYFGKDGIFSFPDAGTSIFTMGATGWYMSAHQIASMMGQLNSSPLVNPFPGLFDEMKSTGGFGPGTMNRVSGNHGYYQGHTGGVGTGSWETNSAWMTYDQGYAAAFVINSPVLAKFPLPPPLSSSGRTLLKEAFDAAFP